MKELEINGRKFLYEIKPGHYSEWTQFYFPEPIIEKRKRYFLFGPEIEIKKYEEAFTLNFSILNKGFTKKMVRRRIEMEIDLLNREEEIKNGIII